MQSDFFFVLLKRTRISSARGAYETVVIGYCFAKQRFFFFFLSQQLYKLTFNYDGDLCIIAAYELRSV